MFIFMIKLNGKMLMRLADNFKFFVMYTILATHVNIIISCNLGLRFISNVIITYDSDN